MTKPNSRSHRHERDPAAQHHHEHDDEHGERHVEQSDGETAGQEFADRREIAQPRHLRCGAGAFHERGRQRHQLREDRARYQPVEPFGNAQQRTLAGGAEGDFQQDGGKNPGDEHGQRARAVAGDHRVEHRHGEDRHRQAQHRHQPAEAEQPRQIAAKAPCDAAEPVLTGRSGTVSITIRVPRSVSAAQGVTSPVPPSSTRI